MKKKYIMKTILVIFVITLSLAVIGFSYAYFSTEITGEGKYVILDTVNLKLKYTDNIVLSFDNAIPGDFVTKTFTVENIGTKKVSYNIVWNNLINTINNYDLHLDMKCKSYKNYNTINQVEEGECDSFYKAVPYTETSISKDIEEYIDPSPEAIYCTLPEETTLTQETEYVNGQFTYRYKQTGSAYNEGISLKTCLDYRLT